MIVYFPVVGRGCRRSATPLFNAGAIDVILHDEDMDHYPESQIGGLVASSSLSEMIDDEIESCSGNHGIDDEALPGLMALRDALAAEVAKLDAALPAHA